MCVHVCIWLCTYGIRGSPTMGTFFPFTVWVLVVELRLSVLATRVLLAELSPPPFYILLNIILKCLCSPRVIKRLYYFQL